MDVQYLSRNVYKSEIIYQGITLKLCYLVAESTFFLSILGCNFNIINSIDEFSEESIIQLFFNFSKDDERILETKEDVFETKKSIKQIRKKKNKNKIELNITHDWNKLIKTYKDYIKLSSLKTLEDSMANEHIDLFDKKILWGELLGIYNEKTDKEDTLINYICRSLYLSKQNFFINPLPFIEQYAIKKIEDNDSKSETNENFDFYSLTLFELPAIIDLTSDQMKTTRAQLSSKLKPIWEKIESFNVSIKALSDVIEIEKEMISLFNTLKPGIGIAQKAINENIYIQKSINTYNKRSQISYNMAVCSTDTLINFYEKDKTILPFVASSIKNLIAQNVNISPYQIVYYLNLIECNE